MSEKKLLKSEKIRLKNAKLRAEGKDPLKGWGSMVDSGLGGINSTNRDNTMGSFFGRKIDNTEFLADEQKRLANKKH